jgi:CPA1 family monovalent cation:H+ antiporter
VLVSAAAVLVRILWVFPATYLPRMLNPSLRSRDPNPDWRNVVVIAWSGMRGVISLAAAFALPFTLADGRAFAARNYILFLTFCVILVTLVFQGLTLPLLIRWLRIETDTALDDEERTARLRANEAALELITQLAQNGEFSAGVIDRVRTDYDERLEQLRVCGDTPADRRGEIATREFQQLQHRALRVERETIIRLRNEHVINDASLRRIQRDLDLAEAQLGD